MPQRRSEAGSAAPALGIPVSSHGEPALVCGDLSSGVCRTNVHFWLSQEQRLGEALSLWWPPSSHPWGGVAISVSSPFVSR